MFFLFVLYLKILLQLEIRILNEKKYLRFCFCISDVIFTVFFREKCHCMKEFIAINKLCMYLKISQKSCTDFKTLNCRYVKKVIPRGV